MAQSSKFCQKSNLLGRGGAGAGILGFVWLSWRRGGLVSWVLYGCQKAIHIPLLYVLLEAHFSSCIIIFYVAIHVLSISVSNNKIKVLSIKLETQVKINLFLLISTHKTKCVIHVTRFLKITHTFMQNTHFYFK